MKKKVQIDLITRLDFETYTLNKAKQLKVYVYESAENDEPVYEATMNAFEKKVSHVFHKELAPEEQMALMTHYTSEYLLTNFIDQMIECLFDEDMIHNIDYYNEEKTERHLFSATLDRLNSASCDYTFV